VAPTWKFRRKVLFPRTANSSGATTFQTYSYAGGVVDSTTFPAGGFAPAAFLFDNIGGVVTRRFDGAAAAAWLQIQNNLREGK
jgi:hypothetical protein